MKRAELNFAQKVWLESLWLGARFFAVLPYWFKYYVVENLLFFILYYCLRYRMKVVNENLRNSFPEKSVGELAVIRREGEVMTYLRPDSKSQVTVEYDEKTNRPLRVHTIVVSTQHDEFILPGDGLTEKEAEERMRKRAIGAFDDMWFENGEDGEFEPDYEYHRKNFIQKLNENEND